MLLFWRPPSYERVRMPFRQQNPPEVDPPGKIHFAVVRLATPPPDVDDKAGKGISINHQQRLSVQ